MRLRKQKACPADLQMRRMGLRLKALHVGQLGASSSRWVLASRCGCGTGHSEGTDMRGLLHPSAACSALGKHQPRGHSSAEVMFSGFITAPPRSSSALVGVGQRRCSHHSSRCQLMSQCHGHPAHPALSLAQVGTRSLPAPGEQPALGSGIRQRLQMSPSPPSALNQLPGAEGCEGGGSIHTAGGSGM